MWQLGPLAPDKPARLNDSFLKVADGVYPLPDGYRPVGSWEAIFSALSGTVRGAAAFTSPKGVGSIVAGTQTNLYKAYGLGWESIGSGFSLQGGQRWRFAQFGGIGVATNGADAMQKIDLTTLEVSPLAGSPPKAEILAVIKDFLFAGVINGDTAQVRWSGRNNAEFWTVAQRFSDFQILPDGGRVNGILSGEFGIILQRNAIRRVDFVGGNTVFAFSVVSTNVGCISVHSVAQWGRFGFFLSDNGFMMWDGAQIVPIGQEVINREFADNYTIEDYPNMSTAVDPDNDCVKWSMGDKVYIYNWVENKWSTVTYASPIIFSGVTKGVNIDETDPLVGVTDDDVDGAGLVSLDDVSFKGGQPKFYVFSSSGALGEFSGTPMTATFTGNDIEIAPGRNTRLKRSRVESDAASDVSLRFLVKQQLGASGVSTTFSTMESGGHLNTRLQGRYLRPTLTISSGATWEYVKGVEFEAATGNRL
jgi:hypothetical protein